jgi:uncharacterized protein (TIGR02271 family)
MSSASNSEAGDLTVPLHTEEVTIQKLQVANEMVRVSTIVREQEQLVDEELTHERVEVERVPIGRPVDVAPPVREEGDTTIMPVMEEIVVVERRLILKEEVRIRRVRVTEQHRETVTVRKQDAVITRIEAGLSAMPHEPDRVGTDHPTLLGIPRMNEQTLVAVYDTAAHADAAVRDLEAANVPADAISRHANSESMQGSAGMGMAPAREQGFWASLFGGEPDHDTAVYDRSIDDGSTVVTVRVPEEQFERVSALLEQHDPVDLDERAGRYGSAGTATISTARPPETGTRATTAAADDASIQLAEESLSVGKRAVSGGTTRIRRYVVETPVQEQVTLHGEKVTTERRPVTDGRPVGDADFTEKTIEMTETSEEAVVAKTARVTEEVSLRKDASDRVETVRDTVRRDEVEIEQVPGGPTTSGMAGATPATPAQRAAKI